MRWRKRAREYPREVRFTTWTLKYNRMRWVVVDGRRSIGSGLASDATLEGDHGVRATTLNVSAVSFEMGPGAEMLNPACEGDGGAGWAEPDGGRRADATVRGARASARRAVNGRWPDDDAKTLRKRHDLQGPIDDAYMDSFLMVRPTGTPHQRDGGEVDEIGTGARG